MKGSLDNLQDAPRITLRGDWQKLNWPLNGTKSQISSEQGSLELAGLLSDYQLMLNAQLTQPYLPKAHLAFQGRGSTDALSIRQLELKSTAGAFQLGGDVSWKDTTVFNLTATGQNFNPAILLSELPGSLTFNAHLKGKLAGKMLQLDAEINKLAGKLRGYPVSTNGKLALAGDLLKVDALRVVSGANNMAVNGALGQEHSALDIVIDAPALESLWPNLGGSLKGDGHLQGALKNPSIQFQAKGKRLYFAEYRTEQLALDIDYHADAKKTSKIQLAANGIKTGTTQISKLLIDGLGTLEQHNFKADISSSYGDVSTALQGGLKGDVWRGDFSKLDLKPQDSGRWQLKNNLVVQVAKKTAGVDVTLAEACLIQQSAALCTQGRYLANSDFQFQAKATAIPMSLMQAYLHKQMKLKGIINANADLHRQNGLLNGNYRLAIIPANAKIRLPTQQGSTEFALGSSSLSGKLKGTMVSADFDLALADQDYLRGQLQLDTGKTQALSGQITASVLNFAVVKPFVPQLSDINGNLKADLTLQGTTKKPVISGTVDLKQGAIEMADKGFGLRSINLQAVASGGGNNRMQLQGSALPVSLHKADAPEQFRLKGMININADLQRQAGLLAGHYRVEVPANTSIALKTREASTEIPLGASYLSGSINGNIISADLNLALAAQDFVRGQLQLNTDEARSMSGQVTASVLEFAPLNPFVPQLSNIKGNLKADMALTGTADKPIVKGAIHFTGGSVDLTELGVRFREIKIQALAAPTGHTVPIQLSGSAKSGQGSIKLEGLANLSGTTELLLSGTDFEVAKLPEAQIAVSPELRLVFAKSHGKVTGQLNIPKATLKLQQLPENAVKVSSDEVILGEEKPKPSAAVATNIDAAIDVELGKQVHFSGQGLETNLSGRLKIIKTGEKMTMYGNVDMDKARYKSYGQDLTVRKGQFLFNGPIDKPWLDVEAIRVSKNEKVTAILNLSGPFEAPQTRLSSEPALPESEVLAYLVTGKPLSEVSKSEGNMVASAALSYGASQVSWLTDKLGVDEFEVKEGKTLQDTLVAVGQYLTPDFYMGTKVGLFNKQAVLVLKRKLTDTFNVETQVGTSQRIKLNYEFDAD